MIVVVFWAVFSYSREGFNANTTEFIPLGSDRYGLRGDKLRRSSIEKLFIRPDRRIRLNHAGGRMFVANISPMEQGDEGCTLSNCPINDGYDSMDKCYSCVDQDFIKTKIPLIHPH